MQICNTWNTFNSIWCIDKTLCSIPAIPCDSIIAYILWWDSVVPVCCKLQIPDLMHYCQLSIQISDNGMEIYGYNGHSCRIRNRESNLVNTLRPRQNSRHFPDDIFKCIFLNENVWILIKISLKFVPNGSINNIPALVQIMVWRRPGDKPLSETMMVRLPTHIYVTRPRWVDLLSPRRCGSDLKNIMLKLSTQRCLDNCCEIALRWMPKNINNRKWNLLRIIAWYYQTTSHYLS